MSDMLIYTVSEIVHKKSRSLDITYMMEYAHYETNTELS